MIKQYVPKTMTLKDSIILSIAVRTDGTQATYNLTQASITEENISFTESKLLDTLSSTFYHCSDCKSFDWSQQSATV